ncbi:hypothetical protein [Cytobacillus oceanisediminis]|uniref:hypothetical protein n=1 Tax=Cytobacillus oceanisediminis TaxID=665099 RepID=UPI002041E9A2|nr:hypothetical protein [Cytobacillus oceanisediminis]MCM3405475.1 hypothetical protein [Cytobacillus oceanisediminis]
MKVRRKLKLPDIEIVLLDGTRYKNDPKIKENLTSVGYIQRQFRVYGYYEISYGNSIKTHIKARMVKSVGEVNK